MTLSEYQQSQNVALKRMDIQMGSFNNMILVDDWMAIQYDIITTNPQTGEASSQTLRATRMPSTICSFSTLWKPTKA